MIAAWLATLLSMLVLPPPVAGVADYQIGGAYEPASEVSIVTRDRADPPVPDTYSICYVNAFQTQPGSDGYWEREHPDLLLRETDGTPLIDPDWPDEVIFDIATPAQRDELARVVGDWFGDCARDGFQAVEPDNLDSWTRSTGLIGPEDTAAFARLLVEQAHARGLAIAQKNAVELIGQDLGFDFAVAEECEVYRECDDYVNEFDGRVIEIEYTDTDPAAFARACAARSGQISILWRDRDVAPDGAEDYVYEHC
ncbi:endo alpha-1,4 polygalactosaminidase [Aeromicrobium sp. CF3.5]|uniref:endo alpha-1,4 polygalactosaminidase n=1 Tax=Aeromicrobium sp. CF3.5 TaxID=3373078 RepID=UPI003EE54130